MRVRISAVALLVACSPSAPAGSPEEAGPLSTDAANDSAVDGAAIESSVDATIDSDDGAIEASSDAPADAGPDAVPGSSGSLDTTFGDGGHTCFSYASGAVTYPSTPYALSVGADDSLLVVGRGRGMLAVRFARDGKVDETFNPPGKGVIDVHVGTGSFGDDARGVVVTASGAIVLAGTRSTSSVGSAVFERLSPDGTLDSTYGDPKATDFGLGGPLIVNALTAMGDKFLAAGFHTVAGKRTVVIARTDATGALDTTFASGGARTFDFAAGKDSVAARVWIVDGKILVAGGIDYDTTSGRMAFARLLADGSLDASFGSGGLVEASLGAGPAIAFDVARQSDGKLVFAGVSGPVGFVLGRMDDRGVLDSTYGGGLFASKFGVANDSARAVLVQADGRAIFAGESHKSPTGAFALERHAPDGTYDSAFGAGGFVTTSIPTGEGYVVALGTQSDGRIVAAGRGNSGVCVARYWP